MQMFHVKGEKRSLAHTLLMKQQVRRASEVQPNQAELAAPKEGFTAPVFLACGCLIQPQ